MPVPPDSTTESSKKNSSMYTPAMTRKAIRATRCEKDTKLAWLSPPPVAVAVGEAGPAPAPISVGGDLLLDARGDIQPVKQHFSLQVGAWAAQFFLNSLWNQTDLSRSWA
jgi:hypothetical protein